MKKLFLVTIFLVAHVTIHPGREMDRILNGLNRLHSSLKEMSSIIDILSILPYIEFIDKADPFKNFENGLKDFNTRSTNILNTLRKKDSKSNLLENEIVDIVSLHRHPALQQEYLFVNENQKMADSRRIFAEQEKAFKSIEEINNIIAKKELLLDRSVQLLLSMFKKISKTKMAEIPAILDAIENGTIKEYAQKKIDANFGQVNNSIDQYHKTLVAKSYNEQEISDTFLTMMSNLMALLIIINFSGESRPTLSKSLYDKIDPKLYINIEQSMNNLKAIAPSMRQYLLLQFGFFGILQEWLKNPKRLLP